MKETIGIFGTSGFARECADIAYTLGYQAVLLSDSGEKAKSRIGPYTVVPQDKVENIKHAKFIIGIGNPKVRERLASYYTGKIEFCNLIHPSVTFGAGQLSKIEERVGIIACAGARFTNGIDIGNFSIFNLNSTIGHDVEIGEYSTISPLASISGNVLIGRGVTIGTGANISNGTPEKKLSIGAEATIGAGAVVVKDCDELSVYAGVPARRIK